VLGVVVFGHATALPEKSVFQTCHSIAAQGSVSTDAIQGTPGHATIPLVPMSALGTDAPSRKSDRADGMTSAPNIIDIARQGGRVALVMGAGGSTGLAFHAGTLLALSHDFGWNPNDATLIQGTSAGAIAASLLRHGLGSADLCALITDAPRQFSDEARRLSPPSPGDVSVKAPSWRSLRLPPLMSPRRMMQLTKQGPVTFAALTMMRSGSTNLVDTFACLDETWPTQSTTIAAVRESDGCRVGFDNASGVSFRSAIAASSAVPGVVQPVQIGNATYVDGGIASPTNLDLLDASQFDAIFVLSPMSGDSSRTLAGHGARREARRRLTAELRNIGNTPCLVFEPKGRLSEVILDDALSAEGLAPIVANSFTMAGEYLHRSIQILTNGYSSSSASDPRSSVLDDLDPARATLL
jgi:NTE family protein